MKIAKYRFHTVLYTGIIAFLFSVQTHADKDSSASITQLLKSSRANMIYIEGGTFTMGQVIDKGQLTKLLTAHQVTLSNYYISKDNVSYGEYDTYTQSAGQPTISEQAKKNGAFFRAENYPVMDATWNQAHSYCSWLAKETGLPYALATEAEWEYAARNRGNLNWEFPTNNGKQELGINFPSEAQLTSQSGNITGDIMPLPVGTKIPCTPLGVCGMAGEVLNWVNDWYQPDYNAQAVIDPQGPTNGTQKVVRGGGGGSPEFENSLNRGGQDPNTGLAGFRCVINSTTSPDKLGAFASGYPK